MLILGLVGETVMGDILTFKTPGQIRDEQLQVQAGTESCLGELYRNYIKLCLSRGTERFVLAMSTYHGVEGTAVRE